MVTIFFLFLFFSPEKVTLPNPAQMGEQLFETNCMGCHINGKNLIIPEKNLQKETLKNNGMDTVDSLMYQITNGKNGMPAFGGRLTENQIETIAYYVLERSEGRTK